MKALIRWVTLFPIMALLGWGLDLLGIWSAASFGSMEMPDSVGKLTILIFLIVGVLPMAIGAVITFGTLVGMFPMWWTKSPVALGSIATLFVLFSVYKFTAYWGEWWIISYLVLSFFSICYGMVISTQGEASHEDWDRYAVDRDSRPSEEKIAP